MKLICYRIQIVILSSLILIKRLEARLREVPLPKWEERKWEFQATQDQEAKPESDPSQLLLEDL